MGGGGWISGGRGGEGGGTILPAALLCAITMGILYIT